MLLPIVLNSMNALSKEQLINEIVEMNAESKELGIGDMCKILNLDN